jgi:hypothetical protein
VGPGVSPRPIPFTDRFVFLREVPGSRRVVNGATQTEYAVMRAAFDGGAPELVGGLRAAARPGAPPPVRTIVIGEAREGFVLRGEGVGSFVLPGPNEARP